jgi:hypothetical protein
MKRQTKKRGDISVYYKRIFKAIKTNPPYAGSSCRGKRAIQWA